MVSLRGLRKKTKSGGRSLRGAIGGGVKRAGKGAAKATGATRSGLERAGKGAQTRGSKGIKGAKAGASAVAARATSSASSGIKRGSVGLGQGVGVLTTRGRQAGAGIQRGAEGVIRRGDRLGEFTGDRISDLTGAVGDVGAGARATGEGLGENIGLIAIGAIVLGAAILLA